MNPSRNFSGVFLTQKVGWQTDAAAMVAAAVSKYRFVNEKRRGRPPKGDPWLMFLGVDDVGKKKMAAGLAELVFGSRPLSINLGQAACPCDQEDDEECSARLRGRTLLDRVADAVRRNPFSLVVLDNVDHADNVIHNSLIRSTETGSLADSRGREVSLRNVIFVLTATEWIPESYKCELSETIGLNEARLAAAAATFRPMQLRISNRRTSSRSLATNKRPPPAWLEEREGRKASSRKPRPAIDLNLSAGNDNVIDASHGSHNSSDLTIETTLRTPPAAMKEIANQADELIVFKSVNFDWMSKKISDSMGAKFSSRVENSTFEVDDEVLEQLLGAMWFGQRLSGTNEWVDRVIVPVFRELQCTYPIDGESMAVRLVVSDEDAVSAAGNLLPSMIPLRYSA